jgi:hypothetical protein
MRPILAACLIPFAVLCLACAGGGTRPGAFNAPTTKPPAAPPPKADMTLKEFVLQKPAGAKAVRAECNLATYYNFAFDRCAETHYSFTLTTRSPFTIVHAYAPKNSEHGRRLYDMLKDGSKRELTLRLQRVGPDGNPLPAEHDSCFALVGIVDGAK